MTTAEMVEALVESTFCNAFRDCGCNDRYWYEEGSEERGLPTRIAALEVVAQNVSLIFRCHEVFPSDLCAMDGICRYKPLCAALAALEKLENEELEAGT